MTRQVKKLAPASLAARLQRKKYPPPQTLRFATFARKPTVNNMAVSSRAGHGPPRPADALPACLSSWVVCVCVCRWAGCVPRSW